MKPDFKDRFGIANPALSGTSYMSVALLEKQFGWKFFEDIKANGAVSAKAPARLSTILLPANFPQLWQ